MVGPQYDLLANPLGAIRSTFENAIASGTDPASLNRCDWGAVDLFRQFLADESNFSQVPVLTAATIRHVKPNTLVRFRGFIQDMFGNECYVGAYKDGSAWRTNKFMDFSPVPMASPSPDTLIWERRVHYCIPIPGLNPWAEVGNDSMDWTSEQREKRRRPEDDSPDMPVSCDNDQGSPSTKKMREGEDSSLTTKSQRASLEIAVSSTSLMSGLDSNSPACIVKIYDTPDSELNLNDIFEFVGILTDPVLHEDNEDSELSNSELSNELCAEFMHPKVPRLHCLIHRKLAVQDFIQNNPILEPKPDLVKGIRETFLRHLSSVLGNDDVAAHFVLLHLFSKVHARVDDHFPVGKLSVNLTSFSKETASIFGSQLTLVVKNLLPFTHSIPLTVEYLNTASLVPTKNYETDRLETAVLQMAESSHLIVDETKLEAGSLNSVGVENVRLLGDLVELQKVDYNFMYCTMPIETDVQVLVLSEGKSNILPADVIVPFQPSATNCSEAVAAETLDAWRWYLATVRQLPHSIGSEVQKVVENDFVEARQTDRSLTPQDFSRLLTMGRLMSKSFGETSLSLEHWQMVKDLERLRRERLK